MPSYHSRRARILSQVLEYVNNDDWDDRGDFLVFGKEAFESWCESPRERSEDATDRDLRKLVTKMKVAHGISAVAKRIRMDIPREPELGGVVEWLIKKFDGQQLAALTHELNKSTSAPFHQMQQTKVKSDSDLVDAAFADEFVGLLDQTIERIHQYGDFAVRRKTSGIVRYFDEVHRCFLFGLHIACAVLCRALLESALVEQVDPKLKLKPRPGERGSHIKRMINKAGLNPRLAQAAERIKKSGDSAIHDYESFHSKYAPGMQKIVEDTRKILLALYG